MLEIQNGATFSSSVTHVFVDQQEKRHTPSHERLQRERRSGHVAVIRRKKRRVALAIGYGELFREVSLSPFKAGVGFEEAWAIPIALND